MVSYSVQLKKKKEKKKEKINITIINKETADRRLRHPNVIIIIQFTS